MNDSVDPSIVIDRGGWRWCTECGDLQGPCSHFPTLYQAAPDLLQAAKCFVRWVDACWGASEILHPKTIKEYEEAKKAIQLAEGKP